MTNQQRLIVGLAFVVAVIGGGVIGIAVLGGGGGDGDDASPSPVAVATLTPAPGSVDPSASPLPSDPPSPSASVAASPSALPTASPPPTASPTPAPTVAPGRLATVVLTQLRLDAAEDPDGLNRRITFRSRGSGLVAVAVRALSPQGSVVMCLSADGERLDCERTANGSINAETTKNRADFALTLRGEGIETPVVEVTITFPARNPAITIANARFDGTLYPETNGLQLFVSPRDDGDVEIEAQWGGKPFNYEIDLLEQGGPGAHVLANQGPSTGALVSLPVTRGNPWKLVLQNINEGFGVTSLDATIAWP